MGDGLPLFCQTRLPEFVSLNAKVMISPQGVCVLTFMIYWLGGKQAGNFPQMGPFIVSGLSVVPVLCSGIANTSWRWYTVLRMLGNRVVLARYLDMNVK